MPYDEVLAERIRAYFAGAEALTEKRMFGGIGWMISGNMAAGAQSKGNLIVRSSREDFEGFCALPGAGPMKRGQSPMTGWILVDRDVVQTDEALHTWLERGATHARSLPPK